jgi:hypothetical protein
MKSSKLKLLVASHVSRRRSVLAGTLILLFSSTAFAENDFSTFWKDFKAAMRLKFAAIANVFILLWLSSLGFSETPAPAALPTSTSRSPDKQWEYKCVEYSADDCLPQIVKVGTTKPVVDLNDVPDGARGMGAEILWAPDSKRFAFNYSTPLTHHSYETVAFYQLRNGKWEALRSLADGLEDEDYPRRCDPYHGTWQLRNWTDPSTAILYAVCSGEVDSAFLFTLKFDEAGKWKIVKTHRMSKKEIEEEE